jgi:hypothetical protein
MRSNHKPTWGLYDKDNCLISVVFADSESEAWTKYIGKNAFFKRDGMKMLQVSVRPIEESILTDMDEIVRLNKMVSVVMEDNEWMRKTMLALIKER